jgi:hypothetical protein
MNSTGINPRAKISRQSSFIPHHRYSINYDAIDIRSNIDVKKETFALVASD